MRYAKQVLKRDCGLVSIHNALRWCGLPNSYRHNLPLLKELFAFDPELGTSMKLYHKIFKSVKVFKNKTIIQNSKLRQFKNLLNGGYSAILSYRVGHGQYHTCFVYFDKGIVEVVNSDKTLKEMLNKDNWCCFLRRTCAV